MSILCLFYSIFADCVRSHDVLDFLLTFCVHRCVQTGIVLFKHTIEETIMPRSIVFMTLSQTQNSNELLDDLISLLLF